MNEILQKRIEEATNIMFGHQAIATDAMKYILQHLWISVDEALPEENRIIAKLSKSFCNKDNCYEILCRIAKEYVDLKHPDGYYDLCGENVPTSAITHWMPIPSLEGGE